MKFYELSNFFSKLEKTSSRIEMTKILARLLRETERREVERVVYLLLGTLAPSFEGIVFNIAEKMMLRGIAEAYGKELADVEVLFKQKGDLGEVAENLAPKKSSRLTVSEVYERLSKIAIDEGEGSQERKIQEIARLFSELDALSIRYVARIPVGKLRLGFSDKTILDALSWMERGDKSAKKELDRAYHVLPDVGQLARRVKEVGIEKATEKTKPVVGVPVLPMLAQRLKSPKEMIEKMGRVAVEPKLDGLRILLHYKRGKKGFVKAFTRNLNETSWMFPELSSVGEYVKASEIILDTEAIGIDEKRKAFANFQTTMTRRRKHAISETASAVPIQFCVFDVLYKDGKDLMDLSYIERRKELEKTIADGKVMKIVDVSFTKNHEEISRLNAEKKEQGFEGIIVKRVDSRYVPGRTGWRWVKMKEAEEAVARLVDTLDCVIMGYSVGKGKRVQFGVGQFLAGVVDGEKVKTITKVGTGLTDEKLKELKRRLVELEVRKKPKEYVVHKDLDPDYWVEPKLVVELAADEITKSPKHTSGYALRFPRLVRFRDDKDVSSTTEIREVERIYKLQ